MAQLWQDIREFAARDDGATAIEYAMIAGIVSIAIVGSLTQVNSSLVTLFNYVSTQLQAASN